VIVHTGIKRSLSNDKRCTTASANNFGVLHALPVTDNRNAPVECSKRPDFSPALPRRAKTRHSADKAAAREEARKYEPHLVRLFALVMGLGERNDPSRVSDSDTLLLRVEPLRDARTKLADFFSILLIQKISINDGRDGEQ
jgi:hypothetical protein